MFLRALRASISSCAINQTTHSFQQLTWPKKKHFFALYIYIILLLLLLLYKIFVLFLFLYSTRFKCCFYSNKLVFDLFPPIDLRASNAGPLETKQENLLNFVSMGSISSWPLIIKNYQNDKKFLSCDLTRLNKKDDHLVIFLFQHEIWYGFARITRKYQSSAIPLQQHTGH